METRRRDPWYSARPANSKRGWFNAPRGELRDWCEGEAVIAELKDSTASSIGSDKVERIHHALNVVAVRERAGLRLYSESALIR